jgi:hypothetical protein
MLPNGARLGKASAVSTAKVRRAKDLGFRSLPRHVGPVALVPLFIPGAMLVHRVLPGDEATRDAAVR